MRTFATYCFLSISLSLICLAFTQSVNAQNRVIINQADQAEGVTIDGESVRKILGNVILTTDEMVLETDSVYQYIDRNLLMAFNIQIETDNEMIWADTLYHDTEAEFSRLRGRVIVQSDQNIMFSDSIDVDMETDIATFEVPVRFEDQDGTLIAQSGLYYQEVDSAVFRGNVQLSDTTQYIEADSLFMNRTSDLYEMFGNVFAHDYEDDVRFSGQYLYADSTDYRLLKDDAWLMEVSESKEDTTHLFAETIELTEVDTVSYMDAFGNVRMWSLEFSAIADTANYRDDLDQFILRSSPKLWHENIQLSGPYTEAYMEDDNIRFLTSFPRPIVVQEDSLTGRLHQMTGDTLNAYFEEGELERIRVFNNTEIIFHQRDENDQPDGLIELISAGPSIMYFENGEFDFFKAQQNIDGSYLPEDSTNVQRRLDNFQWNPDLRPERPDVQTPRLPPIPEERPFELPPKYLRYLENQPGVENAEVRTREPDEN
ncbi:OstA-like protein [Rhodohalobacter sp. 614A]|uniref:OstA-like protein n=1 Tax=Rhodohalobacter sp. 614A TaxID=2908649 RepID=UPI001F2380DE|nr:OstA-like protein [Rhodohalobacter sp. 614A]